MKSRKFLEKKVLEVLIEELNNGKRNPVKLSNKILTRNRKVPIKNQLQKLKCSKSDIRFVFQLIFEAVNKAAVDTNGKYYPMEEINALFNLTDKS